MPIKQPSEVPEPYIKVMDSVASRKDLNSSEKLLISLIAGLSTRHGYCDASNAYLAARLGGNPKYISEVVTELQQRGIFAVTVNKIGGFERRISLVLPIRSEPDSSPVQNAIPIRSQPDTPIRSEQETYPATTGDPIRSEPDHILNLKEKNIKALISPAPTPAPALVQKEDSGFKTSFSGGQTKAEQITEGQATAGDGERTKNQEDPHPADNRSITLVRASAARRSEWDAMPIQAKSAFLADAETELKAAGVDDPPARAVESRAFTLYAKAQAKAWIDQHRK